MQFFPVDFQAFGEQVLGIATKTVGSKAKSLLSRSLSPRNTISAGVNDSANEVATQNKISFRNLLQKQQTTKDSDTPVNGKLSRTDLFALREVLSDGAGMNDSANEVATQNKTSFQNLLQKQQATKDSDTPVNGKLSRTDLLALREVLSEQGVNGDRLNRLNGLIESGRAVSAEDVLKALQGIEIDGIDSSLSFDLTKNEMADLKSLLGKLGFGESEIDGILDELANGGDINVWNLLDGKIASLDTSFDVSKEEVSALARAFRLSDAQRTQLEGIFTPSLTVNSSKLAEALALMNSEMAARKQSDLLVQGTDVVQKSVADVLALAKERKEVEDKSDNRQSQLAHRMNTRILDKVTSQGDTLPQAAPNPDGKEAQLAMHGERTPDDLEDALPEHGGKDKADQQLGDSKGRAAENRPTPKAASANETFIGKVINADPSILGNTQTQNAEGARTQTANFTSQLFHQVESGILKNLQEGVKQLTLQLEPGNLGSMTLIVSVRENEVNAIIRPDNPETAKLIEEQLYKVRQALESQGLKVDNLEVQSNAAERDNPQEWQGASKHNFTQQELEYRERARLLHKLHQADNAVAQDVQNNPVVTANAAKISQSEIYIVA